MFTENGSVVKMVMFANVAPLNKGEGNLKCYKLLVEKRRKRLTCWAHLVIQNEQYKLPSLKVAL